MRKSLALVAVALPLLAACGSNEAPPAAPQTPAAPSVPPPPPEPVATAPEAAPPAPAPAPKLSGPNAFTFRALGAFGKQKGNVFYSGASLEDALGMLELGAKSTTKEELDEVLAIPADTEAHVAKAKAARASLNQAAGKAELAIANRVWVDKKSVLEPAFAKAANEGYGAGAQNVDFVGAAEPSRKTINAWVAKQTKDKIKDLLPEGSLTTLTRLVLTNAIYFKGLWAEAFEPKATAEDTFHAEDGDLKRPFMKRTGKYRFAEVDGTQVLELPYKDSDLAMVALLPKAGGLEALEKALGERGLAPFVGSLAPRQTAVVFPKFTFSWGRSVKADLEALGLPTMFSGSADLSGLRKPTNEPPLFVSDVFHKAFVQVDEKGTEAAAATGVVVAVKSAVMTQEFRADRPFVFVIRNTKSDAVLFVGRVAKPEG